MSLRSDELIGGNGLVEMGTFVAILLGEIVGGLVIGVLQNLADGYLSRFTPGGVKEVFPFAVMVVILLFKPYGLWGWIRIERV